MAVTLLTSHLTPDHLRTTRRLPSPDPLVVRHHAVRLALALGFAGTVAEAVGSSTPIREHALWLGIGVWIVLQPYLHDTVAKAVQRGIGTVAGGLLTLALVQAVPAGLWVGWMFLVLAFVCFGIRPVNYGWYCVFLTPIIVIGFGPVVHDYAVLEARLGWTIAGSLLALLVRFALWPAAGHPRPDAPASPT
ncbi:FUSC family protein [Aquihabitans sp. G128]|uniref:FUSC family protein n=1 Tax=Aquihabitans sp. G128 TaxID=2849779 RepID=UPI001C223FA4|nr:FUSC family protein [Aquihabitans sp. G128]QXC61177.1 FUSC family protein [Aquihabitans sp. G128]